ncbi:molybdenum cofactor guanylyltransferase MobA [Bordetella sp. 02P26C-1]|uniref:molybdenum cofactor guanylyltransferase MobA n=1 Tax=Bordetella sp. 02P26C-1 TaxID=2683195 RepID=UPI00135427EF|nr:molybdenum cofactor guanylyltransferase MobA [Bordetella sp. 02P26C-1]MVW78520.1 molybdenum cofactor guanylyltransferase MobA [Bordetella sp. 02P26C-1]
MIQTNDITGLILAGGRGSRMGGVDKGLQNFQGMPLALHALMRLSPQVGVTMINANRNLAAYESMGVDVWPDDMADFAGPLAGLAAGLSRCETAYLVTVPCDCPRFPLDMVARLAQALSEQDADIAMVATSENGQIRTQPVFCLLKASLLASLLEFLRSGQRKIDAWTAQHRCIEVVFDDAQAFAGANTLSELQQLAP